ncbi:MAG: phosphopentomutase [bacterium]|nr:phosphopentomutase [bacterium]MDD5756035.1 phosphopentomutase [bacterium]
MAHRVVLIILDSVGIGELPDAPLYQDQGSNTLGNLAKAIGQLDLPVLEGLGLGELVDLRHSRTKDINGCYGRMAESSPGKDTTTGHWELAGLILRQPFPVYPHGFPQEIINAFEKNIGTKVIGNIPASGTEIIKQVGEEHLRTGYPIVYTSADSVFQIACHEQKFGLSKLYSICLQARELLTGTHAVGRVIARPFIGTDSTNFCRTANRKDYSLKPPMPTILDLLQQNGQLSSGIGKIEDIFAGQGLTDSIHTRDNITGLEATQAAMHRTAGRAGLIFVNLVDFDMMYGHRNDVNGYAQALRTADQGLSLVIQQMLDEDLLIVTADHGCDPTTPSTDHSREYVPLLVYGKQVKKNINLGTRATFADVGQTIAAYCQVGPLANGTSFLREIM